MKRIQIDRVELRLRGHSPHRGREVAGELRAALPPAVAQRVGSADALEPPNARIEVPPVRLAQGTSASRVAETVARAVAGSLARRRREG